MKARGKSIRKKGEREGAMEAVERESDRERRRGRGVVWADAEVKSMLLILDSGNGFVLVALCNCAAARGCIISRFEIV